MGKTSRWFRSLLSSKKSPPESSSAGAAKERRKGKWALSKPADSKFKINESENLYVEGLDANKHAIAVAAATAAVAEAALAAAQAAAEVVRLTSAGGTGINVPAYFKSDWRLVEAAIKIQSAFRAYLARRALRALKGLVKLQALVRGRIVRKQSADMLRRMQAMVRIQARASAHRSYVSVSSKTNVRFSNSRPQGVVNARNYHQRSNNAQHGEYISKQMHEYNSRSRINKESSHLASNWLNHWMEQHSWNNRHATTHETVRGDDERSDKILEIDTWKPRQTTRRYDKRQELSKVSSLKLQKPNPSASSEVSSVISQKDRDQVEAWTAESSPKVHSASSRPTSDVRGSFTPTRSECSRSLFVDYLSHPNYMANTESSRAKVRSQSVPKQRMQLNELGMSSTFCHNQWESDAVSERGFTGPTNYASSTRSRGPPSGLSPSYGYRL